MASQKDNHYALPDGLAVAIEISLHLLDGIETGLGDSVLLPDSTYYDLIFWLNQWYLYQMCHCATMAAYLIDPE